MSEEFAEWLKREMPAGTVISDPEWWAPRILKAARTATDEGIGIGSLSREPGSERIVLDPIGDPHIKDGMIVYTAPDALQAEASKNKLLRAQLETVRLQRDKELKEKCEALNDVERLREEVEQLNKAHEEKWAAFCSLNAKYEAAFAELTVIRAMCTSIENREWADHFATGETSSRVEAAFSQLYNDWSALKADAERYRWLRNNGETERGVMVLCVTGWEKPATAWATTFPDPETLDACIDDEIARTAKPEVDHE